MRKQEGRGARPGLPVAATPPGVPVTVSDRARTDTTAHPLVLEQIGVQSVPGFRRGGFVLKDLSPGVNVIHGPNGAGKTTTARAIETLLWPVEAAGEGDALFGQYRLGEATWAVEIGPGRRAWQRNGLPAEAPAFPGETGRDRYRLSLAELLHVEDRAFAAQIVRESAGGFDVAQAVDRLGFGKHPAGYSNASRALQAARQRVVEATQAQEELKEQELRLGVLETARAEAAAAAGQVEVLDHLVELAGAQEEEERLRQQLSMFPEWSERLTGDEVERLDRLGSDQRKAVSDLRAAQEAAARAQQERTEAGLPEEGLPRHQLQALREQLESLRQRDREWREAKRREAEYQATLEDEEARLGGPVTEERLAVLGTLELNALRQATGKADELGQRRARVEAELYYLGPDEEPEDENRLTQGLALLSRWLGAPRTDAARAARLALAAALTAVLVTLAGARLAGADPFPVLVSAAIGLLAGWGVARFLGRASGDPRAVYRQDYERLGLRGPAAWTDEAVEERLQELFREATLAKEAARKAELRQERRRDLQNVEEQIAALVYDWVETMERLGLPASSDLPGLLWLVERIGAWQKAHASLQAQRAALRQVESERSRLVADLAAGLEPFGYPGLQTAEELAGALDALERRRDQWEKAQRDRQAAEDQARQARAEAARAEGEIRRLFERLGLNPDDDESEARVRRAVADLDRYRELDQQLRQASWRVENARKQVEADPDEGAQALDGASLEELLQTRERAKEEAAGHQEYHDQITRTEERIRQAKQAHALEEALAAQDAAADQLREFFRQDAEAHLGEWLAEWVQAESRDSERPHVFHRARELFKQITAGRYSLELQDGTEPVFRALETESSEGRALEELSSGTRVQLLLAVRVAFVETQEQGARLPLVFDEVLANSDDDRAHAIMEAVAALARSGRQVFYFTAQWDEAAKWEQVLKGTDLPHRLIDLGAIRRLHEAGQRPLPPPRPARAEIARPEGHTYHEYGRLLQVPGVDPWAEGAGGVHLWHLLDEASHLYELLRLGIERWGPLRSVGEHGIDALLDGVEPGLGARIYRKASVAARVLEAAVRLWRIGRGRPVDAEVLKASGAVSPTFLGRAAELARRESGDARRLLAALDGGALGRFQKGKIAELRAYLDREGYLDPRAPLDPDEFRARVLADAAEAFQESRLSREHVERLIRSVGGPGPGDEAPPEVQKPAAGRRAARA